MKVLADARDRERFITELNANFCVAASAGAGTTTAIVSRIVEMAGQDEQLILRGEPSRLPRLVVVTYGVLAAEELRVRAKQEMFRQLAGNPARRQQVLAEFSRAYFGTIHSYCLKLLREEGKHLGLPSSVDLLEDENEGLWFRFVETDYAWPEDLDEKIPAAVLRHYTFEQILQLARQMSPDAAESVVEKIPKGEAPKLDFTAAFEARSRGKAADTLAGHLEHLRSWVKQFETGDGYLELPNYERGGAQFATALQDALQPYVTWLNEQAAFLAAHVALKYRDYRVEQGYLTYDDMVIWAKKLLGNPRVLSRMRARGSIVILDEAQDTDANMFAVLTELTRPEGAELYAWPSDPAAEAPLPGRFCFVGDEQQAIYSRRADLARYHSYLQAFRDGRGGELLDFSVTMRCPVAVIREVNRVFPVRLDQNLVKFRQLDARPEAPEGGVRIIPLKAMEDGSVDDRFRDESRQVAAWISEQGLAGLGVTNWSEVAVLCPRISWLSLMAAELKTVGLPFRMVSSKEKRADIPAYSWPVALLHVVLHPGDLFEWIGVLREIYGASDAGLLRAQRGRGLMSPSDDCAQLREALEDMKILWNERETTLVDGSFRTALYVEKVLGVTALEERLKAIDADCAPLRDLRRAAWVAESESVDFFEWVEALRGDLNKAPLAVAGSSDEIQLLTSQKSKGLEWPVVIAPGLGRQIGDARTEYPLAEKVEGRVKAHFNGFTADEEGKARRQNLRDTEYQRLFYVTMTRARNLLVLPDSMGCYKLSKPSFLGLIRREEIEFQDSFALETPKPGAVAVQTKDAALSPDENTVKLAIQSSQKIARKILPHTLAEHGEAEETELRFEPAVEKVVGGVDYGIWWHAVLQYFPWNALEDECRDYVKKEMAEAPRIFRERGGRELELFLKSEIRREMVSGGRHFLAELPFSAPLSAEEVMEGVIDLVVVDARGHCQVLDWKTNRMQAGETPADFETRLKSVYAAQLQAYADVLGRQHGRKVTGVILYATETSQGMRI